MTIVDGRSLPACKQGTTAWIEVHLFGGQTISQSSARVPAHQPEFDETFTFDSALNHFGIMNDWGRYNAEFGFIVFHFGN